MIEKTAVIGHGPSIKGCGEQIDKYKYIIRIPRKPFWLKHPEDFGRRVTHWCGNRATWKNYAVFAQTPECGYFGWHKKNVSIPSQFIEKIPDIGKMLYTNISYVVQHWQKQMVGPTWPYFCNGMGAIVAAVTQLELPVDVFGCDNIKNADNDATGYVGSNIYDGKFSTDSSRIEDYQQERMLIPKMSKEYGIRIEFYG